MVAAPVVAVGGGLDDAHLAGGRAVLGIVERELDHALRELAHRNVVPGIADVEDLARGDGVLVGDDRHQRVDAVVDVGEGALLPAAVDEVDALAAHDVAEELGDDARAAFLGRGERIEPGADPVERAKQREVEPFLLAVRPDHPVHELLRASVDPALLVDRSVDERGILRVELPVG